MGHNFARQNGDEGVRLRALVDKGQTRERPFFGSGELNVFVDNHLQFLRIAPTFALYPQKSGPKGSSFTLDHRLWITLWKGPILDNCRF